MKHLFRAIAMIMICVAGSIQFLAAQTNHTNKHKKERKGEFYFSWGYNKEWYTHSNIKVVQPALGNDYTFKAVKAHDHIGWDEGILRIPISIPQYNYRLGFLINRKKDLFFEINFDHTKYIFADQNAHIAGKLNNRQVDTTVAFNEPNGFAYYLNNGANFLLFNLVKRWHIYQTVDGNLKIDALGKGGIGPVIPHVQNMLFGQNNDAGFQLGGWNMGFEGAIRATFFKYAYLEFSNKVDYARYSNLKVYEGRAKQAFGTYELVLSLGVTFPTGRVIQTKE
ncbi:hypothetical protein [Hydrotalea sp.]|uniref:hypothetical protein n=1 Tax=Hydrotalea sp. TaxID=2881279 RepID=UPI0026211517|nr:hypothetical protein [Hydrotalea sp.]